MNQHFAIGIPSINQADYLQSSLQLYLDDFPDTHIYILDNGIQNFNKQYENVEITRNFDPFCISKSWNWLAKKIYQDHEHALILNDDIYLGTDSKDIIKLLKTPGDLFCAQHEYDYFSAFVLPKKTFNECGGFDEEYTGCYYEDSDYLRTMSVVHGKNPIFSHVLNAAIFRRNSSVTKDPKLAEGRHINERRYISKWGGPISGETFKTPFGK